MPVHPLIAARFPLIAGISGYEEALGSTEAAARFEAFAAPYGPYEPPDVLIDSRVIPGPHGEIPLRIYRPRDLRANAPGLLWMHGGAFVAGDLDMPEAHAVSADFAARGIVVVSVDYRLASEAVHFPVPLDDVCAAWRWCASSQDELGIGADRVAIGGASAGANLALATAVRARDEGFPPPSDLLLAYPVVHFPVPSLSDELAAEMRGLPGMLRFTAIDVAQITRGYVGRLSGIPTEAMPGQGHLEGLPPTRILLSEYDDLRGSGELLEHQLREVGVPVTSTLAEGMLHGHLNITTTEALPEIARSLEFLATPVQ